jgi:uncharacterized protein YciU (UPF0263 family)
MPKRRDKFSPRLSREHSPYLFFLRLFEQRCPVEIFHVSGDKKRKRTLNLNQNVLLSIRIAPAKIQKDFENELFYPIFLRKNMKLASNF